MNHGYLVENCKYRYGRVYSRRKCNCASCTTAIKEAEFSSELKMNHVNGKFCLRSNNCPECCETRWRIRMATHIAFDGERCSRRCEICKGQVCNRVFKEMSEKLSYILYKTMLPRNK